MARRVFADADGHGTPAKRRRQDLAFLEQVIALRAARDVAGLEFMLLQHGRGPTWKKVALRRSIENARTK